VICAHMMTIRGRIRRYNALRGYGFVVPEAAHATDWEEQVFFHFRDVRNVSRPETLKPGQPVVYDVQERHDRPGQLRAVRVQLI